MRRSDPQPEPDEPSERPLPQEVHVFPGFGPEHVLSPRCWCHPERDPEVPLYLHNVAH
jgi:hypothetical protein